MGKMLFGPRWGFLLQYLKWPLGDRGMGGASRAAMEAVSLNTRESAEDLRRRGVLMETNEFDSLLMCHICTRLAVAHSSRGPR